MRFLLGLVLVGLCGSAMGQGQSLSDYVRMRGDQRTIANAHLQGAIAYNKYVKERAKTAVKIEDGKFRQWGRSDKDTFPNGKKGITARVLVIYEGNGEFGPEVKLEAKAPIVVKGQKSNGEKPKFDCPIASLSKADQAYIQKLREEK